MKCAYTRVSLHETHHSHIEISRETERERETERHKYTRQPQSDSHIAEKLFIWQMKIKADIPSPRYVLMRVYLVRSPSMNCNLSNAMSEMNDENFLFST